MRFLILVLVMGFGFSSYAQESKAYLKKVPAQKLPLKKIYGEPQSGSPAKTEGVVVASPYPKQLITKKDFKAITPQVGFLFSDLYGGDSKFRGVELEAKTGFNVGAAFDLELKNSPMVLETGVFYRQMGANIDGSVNQTEVSGEVELNYLSFPVYLKSVREVNALTKTYVKAGAMVSLLLDEEVETKFSRNGQTFSSEDTSPEFKKIDFGPTVGAGLRLKPSGPANYEYTVDANYYLGIIQADSGNGDVYNHALALNLGINYNLK